jgi:hypothetical protein
MGIEPDRIRVTGGDQTKNHIDSANVEWVVERGVQHVLRKPVTFAGHMHHNASTVVLVVPYHTTQLPIQIVANTNNISTRDKANPIT